MAATGTPPTTAILSALAEEQQGLVQQLEDARRVRRAGRDFWCGTLQGQPVVLALSRIGKVAAATTATTLVEAFAVDRIVFTGVGGALGPGVQVGDVVVATHFVQHDMDATPLFPRFEVPLYGQALFACDVTLGAQLLHACQTALAGMTYQAPGAATPSPVAVHRGLVASGDRFVSSARDAAAVQQALQGAGMQALALEMEGAAVAQVCHDYGVTFAAVRTISDRADDSAHVDFPQFVSQVAGRYALRIVDQLMAAPRVA